MDRFLLTATIGGGPFANADLAIADATPGASSAPITTEVLGSGYATLPIAPGLTREYQVQTTVPDDASVGRIGLTNIKVVSATDAAAPDRALIRTTVAQTSSFQPDAMISLSPEDTPKGDNIYFVSGVTPVASAELSSVVAARPTGTSATDSNKTQFLITLQNDGLYPDRIKVTDNTPVGVPITDTEVQYFVQATGADVSTAANGSGWYTPVLAPGAKCVLEMVVTAPEGAAAGISGTRTLVVSSETASTMQDWVFATTYVQGISKLQYSLDEGTTWADVW